MHKRIIEECKELLAVLAVEATGEYSTVAVPDDIPSIVPFLWNAESDILENGFLRLDPLVDDESARAVLLKTSSTQAKKMECLRKIAELCRIILGHGDHHRPPYPDHDHDHRPPYPDHGHRPPGPGRREYIVRPGDTMFLIAQRFGISLDALIRANPQVRNPDVIFPGEVLFIPGGRPHYPPAGSMEEGASGARRYVVKAGDTLETVAFHFTINVSELAAFNPQLEGRTTLSPGETIFVPGGDAVG